MSVAATATTALLCPWCRERPLSSPRQAWCSKTCRQSAFRLRKRRGVSSGPGATPGLLFAYADPPYVGLAHYYADQPSYGGEVDHRALIAQLTARTDLAGWALSCSGASLRELLPMMPAHTRVCPWVKPIGVPRATLGLHNTWEALCVVGGRAREPGMRDWLSAQPARGGGELTGRKPLAFCAFLFDALGMVPGDQLEDLFPGTGIVGRAWASVEASLSAGDQRQLTMFDRVQLLAGASDGNPCPGDASPADHPTTAAATVAPPQRRQRRRLLIEDEVPAS